MEKLKSITYFLCVCMCVCEWVGARTLACACAAILSSVTSLVPPHSPTVTVLFFFFFPWASAYEDHSQGILLRETSLANSILVTFPMRNLLLCCMYIYFLCTIYTLINGTPHTDSLRFFPFVHLTFHSCTSSLTTMLHVLPTSFLTTLEHSSCSL